MTRASREEQSRQLMRQVFLRNRPTTMERLAVVGSALTAMAAGECDHERRVAAMGEAHKLKGILGTYGFAEGSVLAGEAEELLEAGVGAGAAQDLADRLAAYASSLPEA